MSNVKQYQWHKIATHINEIDFNESGLAELEAGGKKICISRYREGIYACTAKCPHAGAHLQHGHVDALGNIVCPLHRYRFNVQNGRNTSGEGYFLKTWPVEVREEGIFVGIESGGLLDWLK